MISTKIKFPTFTRVLQIKELAENVSTVFVAMLLVLLTLVSCSFESSPSKEEIGNYLNRSVQSGFSLENFEYKVFKSEAEGEGRIEISAQFKADADLFLSNPDNQWLFSSVEQDAAFFQDIQYVSFGFAKEFRKVATKGDLYDFDLTLNYKEKVEAFEITGKVRSIIDNAVTEAEAISQGYIIEHQSGQNALLDFKAQLERAKKRRLAEEARKLAEEQKFNNRVSAAEKNLIGGVFESWINADREHKVIVDCSKGQLLVRKGFPVSRYEIACIQTQILDGEPRYNSESTKIHMIVNRQEREIRIYFGPRRPVKPRGDGFWQGTFWDFNGSKLERVN